MVYLVYTAGYARYKRDSLVSQARRRRPEPVGNTVSRNGQLIRVTLTATEWERVKKIARERDLHASQLVSQVIRESLLGAKRK